MHRNVLVNTLFCVIAKDSMSILIFFCKFFFFRLLPVWDAEGENELVF